MRAREKTSGSDMPISRRNLALLGGAVTWVPLAAFSAVQMRSPDVPEAAAFWRDFGVHGRYLISVPLFILGDAVCVPRLWRLIDHFADAGLVEDLEGFEAAAASAHRGFGSRKALIGIALLAWIGAALVTHSYSLERLPAWYIGHGATAPFSLAGWWHVLVSLPLALTLVFVWFWRLCVWALLLLRVARCRLRLIASHPDRSAGLGFLGASLHAFAPIAFALSTISASREVALILNHHELSRHHLYVNIGFAAFSMTLIVLPLCAFTPPLMEAARRGGRAYSKLALQLGQAFETRWLTPDSSRADEDILRVQDFSATIDLYSVVAGARGLRLVPVSRRNLLALGVVLALPFAPVLVMMVPVHVIFTDLRGILL